MKFTLVLSTLAIAGLTVAAPALPPSSEGSDVTTLESTNTAPISEFFTIEGADTAIEQRSEGSEIARRWNYDFSKPAQGFTFEVDKTFTIVDNGRRRTFIVKKRVDIRVWWATGNSRQLRAPEPAALPAANGSGSGSGSGNGNGQGQTTVKTFTLTVRTKGEVFINGRPFKAAETFQLVVTEITKN